MFIKIRQILSAICGEKFDTSPATRSYSSDGYDSENEASLLRGKGDEGEKPLTFQSSKGLVFQIRLKTAAPKVVEDCRRNYESIIEKNDDSSVFCSLGNEAGNETSTIPLNEAEEKPLIFESSRGLILQGHIDSTAKEGNEKPLVDQRIDQGEDIGHDKDEANNKQWKKKIDVKSCKNEVMVEDGSLTTALLLQKGDEEKPLILKSSQGPVFQVHIDPAAKIGIGKPHVDQRNKEVEEVSHHKDVAINKRRKKKKMKKKIVEDSGKNEAIMKFSNVTKKEIVENLCRNENYDDFHQNYSTRSSSSANWIAPLHEEDEEKPVIYQAKSPTFQHVIKYNVKDENGSPLNNQSNVVHKNKTINKSCTWKWREIVKDVNKNETIINGFNSTKKKIEEKEKPLLFKELAARKEDNLKEINFKEIEENLIVIKARGAAFQVRIAEQRNKKNKEIIHLDPEAINKTFIVEEEEKPVILQEQAAKMVTDNKPKADFCHGQIKEIDHHKNKTINKSCTWKLREIIKDDRENESVVNGFNSTKKKIDEDKEKPVFLEELSARREDDCKLLANNQKEINCKLKEEKHVVTKARGAAFQVCLVEQSNKINKEVIHLDPEAINKTFIVEEEKPVTLQKPAAKIAAEIEPQGDFSRDQRKEINHRNDENINRNYLRNNEIVWLKHYNNKQRILMVGEGDFSFSASLAVAFGSASNITATSLNNSGYLRSNYKNAIENIQKLTNGGATVRHGVDATKMSNYSYWQGIKFDRIIYNFPYSGCSKTEPRQTQLRLHLELVRGFLLNAKEMLEEGGEIHISHKTNSFHSDWNLKELAWEVGLWLVQEVVFDKSDYPGYETKQGYRGNINFDCYPSSTYMFASIPC